MPRFSARLVCTALSATLLVLLFGTARAAAPPVRSTTHDEYSRTLYDYVTAVNPYERWQRISPVAVPVGPTVHANSQMFLYREPGGSKFGTLRVAEHRAANETLLGLTVWMHVGADYDPRHKNWYWAHYLPDGATAATSADWAPFPKPGFATFPAEAGRMWVFRMPSPVLIDFVSKGDLAKRVSLVGEGPLGKTVYAAERATVLDYLAAKEGFITHAREGDLWVFRADEPELRDFYRQGELGKMVAWVGEGPLGSNLKAANRSTLVEYSAAKPGFTVIAEDERLWIFHTGSEAFAEFRAQGDLPKRVTWVGEGPRGATLMSADRETLLDYVTSVEGFATTVRDDIIWAFHPGSEAHETFLQEGDLAKSVTLVGEGPRGMSVRGAEKDVVRAYVAAVAPVR